MRVLISAADLAAELSSGTPPLLLDVRWRLGGPPGREEYAAGHLPGAVYVDLDTELAAPATPGSGRHPLPTAEAFQAAARRWGLGSGRPVVVYDDLGNQAAARAWWLLRWAGHTDVRMLDGGLAAWCADGGELSSAEVVPEPGDFEARPGALPVLAPESLQPFDGVLLDARSAQRFRGEMEPVDPVAGHIPGARNVPGSALLDDAGRFRPADELRRVLAAAGVTGSGPVGAYCGSGVSAAHLLAGLALAGFDGALYPGSWSQWTDLGLPVATGD